MQFDGVHFQTARRYTFIRYGENKLFELYLCDVLQRLGYRLYNDEKYSLSFDDFERYILEKLDIEEGAEHADLVLQRLADGHSEVYINEHAFQKDLTLKKEILENYWNDYGQETFQLFVI